MSNLVLDTKTGQMVARAQGPGRGHRKRFFSAGESANFLGWDVQNVSADTAIYANLNKVKARCRDLARNNDYVRNAINVIISNVVGPEGFSLQCKLRQGDAPDKAFNRAIERLWAQAGELKNGPTVCGKLTRVDKARLWWRTLMVDGEVIEILHPGHRGNKFRYATQLIDSARLDWQKNEQLANGNSIKMGVEVDPLGKPVAYWFLNHDSTETFWGYGRSKKEHTRIPAARVRHTFTPEAVGQTRGVPQIASPAIRAHMLQRFEEAVVVGARVAASKVGFFKPNEDYAGESMGDDGEEYEVQASYEPGSFDMLPPGVDVETFDPNTPPVGVGEFTKSMLRGVASGIPGADYVSMASDLEGVNFSSIRAGQLEQRSIYKAMQQFYINHAQGPEFEDWLGIQQFNPGVKIDLVKLAALIESENFRFIGRGWQWVDPLKEVKAYGEAIALRLTSRRRIVAENLGEDFGELLEEIAEDEAAMAALGLQAIEPAPPAPPAQEEDEEEE